MYYIQELIAYPTPVPLETVQEVSYNAISYFGHLKPSTAKELKVTRLDEIINPKRPLKVTKHASKEHVRQFQEEGILKLGTFREYQESENPANQDSTEGQILTWIEQPDLTYYRVGGTGDRFKIFCASLSADKNKETKGYGDAQYTIINLPGFLNAVARSAGIQAVAYQNCLYRNARVLLAEDKQTTGTPNPLEPLTEIQLIAHVALSFIKPQDHSLHQEFRFVWYDKNEKIPPNGIIHCPEARNYCSFS